MNREDWFVTPIWYENTQFDYQSITKYCLELRDTLFPNIKETNIGGWQSVDLSFRDHPELQPIHEIIKQKIIEVNSHVSNSIQLVLNNAWININEFGHRNAPHVHPSSCFSGTIYISVDENTGNIVFQNETPMKHYPLMLGDSAAPLFFKRVTYSPIKGMILIFPSWVSHEVEPNRSNIPRISISFNIKQITRPTLAPITKVL